MHTFHRKPPLPARRPAAQPRSSRTQLVNPLWQKRAMADHDATANEHGRSLQAVPLVQRKATVSSPGDALEREADAVADRVTTIHTIQRERAPSMETGVELDASMAERATLQGGAPLPAAVRGFFEPRFEHDFSKVRVHVDGDAARSVRARAYTIGQNIVFGASEYAPATTEGRRLIAHELAHVVQQTGPSSFHGGGARVQRQVDFGSMYKGVGDKVRTFQGKGGASKDVLTYDEYKDTLTPTELSSASGGHALVTPLENSELRRIFDDAAKALGDPKPDPKALAYLDKLNQGFRVMKIDTVEAQASFLANAYHESGQFRFFTETEGAIKSNSPFQSNPAVKLDTSWLNCAATVSAAKKAGTEAASKAAAPDCWKKAGGAIDFETGGSINPKADWQQSFIGRGPIQVTHRHGYVQVIAVLEQRFEEMEKETPGSQDAKDLREAIDKIKTDPREAANPKYAFLFSAGFMKMPDVSPTPGVPGVRGDVKATQGRVTDWMGSQPDKIQKRKQTAFDAAKKVLMEHWQREQIDEFQPGFKTPSDFVRPQPVDIQGNPIKQPLSE